MNSEKNNNELIIPENCPPRDYVIIGFTKEDIAWIAGMASVGIFIALILYSYNKNSIAAVAMFFVSVIVGINIFRRDNSTENLIDKINVIRAYKKGKKSYEYKYVNPWDVEIKHEKNRRDRR